MKRRFPALVVMTMLSVACAPTPPERASLPRLDEVLAPPAQCTFLVGDPQGVLVQEVIPDSAADGLLLAGDVIVAFDDVATPDSEALLAALDEKSAGEMVELEILRDEETTWSRLTLGADPADAGQPRIGVMIRTQYQTVEASEVTTEVSPGPLIRPISIAGTIYLFDPVGGVWERTGLEVPAELNWVAATSGLYAIDGGTVTELETGEEISHDGFQGWEPIRMIGSVGPDLMLVVTQDVPNDPERVLVGISRFDPVVETTRWVEPVTGGFGIPISALASPDGDSVVVVGVNEGGSEITGVDLREGDGSVVDRLELAPLGTPVGWMDDQTVLFRSDAALAVILTVADGAIEEITLEAQVENLPLIPLGDGSSVLAVDGQALVRDDLTVPGDLRVLAENCAIGRIGELGWGA